VREALREMKQQRILSDMHPFDEKLIYAPSKRRPKIVDAIWTLFSSSEFVDEIIAGNKEMKKVHGEAGAKKRDIRFLPGFRDETGRGNRS
jgi:hypothetical protein